MKATVFDDNEVLPGLTLAQPYAGAVLLAAMGYEAKDIETRKTRFRHVGSRIVICAGLDRWAEDLQRLRRVLLGRGVPETVFDRAMAFRGQAVAVATVAECRPLVKDDEPRSLYFDEADPRWAWVLADLKVLRPFHVRGTQGFTRIPRERVEAALREAA